LIVATVRILATVAAVPAASQNVVFIVADAITLEFHDRAIGFRELRVKTSALEAVGQLLHIASHVTAVTAIPATATVVVIVIAVVVPLVSC